MIEEKREMREEKEEEKKEKTGKKKILKIAIISGLAFVIIIAIGAISWVLLPKFSKTSTEVKTSKTDTNISTSVSTYALDDFIVNLFHPSEDRFLRIKIEFELEGQDTQKEIEKKLPKIRDSLLMLLSSKSVEEISTLQGKLILKNEIINRINSILNTGHISAVYFTEFIIQ